jgi:histone deacetylase 11
MAVGIETNGPIPNSIMIPICYSRKYDFTALGLERLHPFDGRKYRRIHDYLIHHKIRQSNDFIMPSAISSGELLRTHSPAMLRKLKDSDEVARILELPFVRRMPAWLADWRILRPMRYATGGTVEACRLAIRNGIAINLGGGFHHASGTKGHGFCVYADAPLAAYIMHAEGLAKKVMVVDLDAHQGDGTATAFRNWPWASIFDIYQANLFPNPKEPEDYGYPIPGGTNGREYRSLLETELPVALDFERPDLVIYNAGVDPYESDPLSGLKLSGSDLADRDFLVISLCQARSIPVAMILSGGYSKESWHLHAESIRRILQVYDRPGYT